MPMMMVMTLEKTVVTVVWMTHRIDGNAVSGNDPDVDGGNDVADDDDEGRKGTLVVVVVVCGAVVVVIEGT